MKNLTKPDEDVLFLGNPSKKPDESLSFLGNQIQSCTKPIESIILHFVFIHVQGLMHGLKESDFKIHFNIDYVI